MLGVDQQYPGVIRAPEWKNGFDNARRERTLEGIGCSGLLDGDAGIAVRLSVRATVALVTLVKRTRPL